MSVDTEQNVFTGTRQNKVKLDNGFGLTQYI